LIIMFAIIIISHNNYVKKEVDWQICEVILHAFNIGVITEHNF
jgi:hypothetical protein